MSEEAKVTKRPWWKPSIGVTIFLVLFGLWWGVPSFLKWRADVQVKELCAKDGGVKVYETVTLSPEMFNQWGQISFYRPDQKENALGPKYKYIWDVTYLKRGHPDLIRHHSQIIQRSNNRVLGETVSYTRRGGDPIGPWVGSHFSCPSIEEAGTFTLFDKVFLHQKVKEELNNE